MTLERIHASICWLLKLYFIFYSGIIHHLKMSQLLLENAGIVKPKALSYLWEVKNYSATNCKRGEYLASPIFSTTNSAIQERWLLHLFPKGDLNAKESHISIYLKYLGQSNVTVDVTITLLSDKQCKMSDNNFRRLFETGSSAYGFHNFKEQSFVTDRKNRVLLNDTICILCEITYDTAFEPFEAKCVEENVPNYCRLKEFDEFEKLLEAESSTDVTIRIGNDEIKVHKAIVMCRSPVFQAMFEHEMKEKEQSVVEITDITHAVMKEVVRFMYVGKVSEINEIVSDLLVAAEKYSIKGLKVLCEKQLFENLTVVNAIEYLKLADMYNSTNLKSNIITFIVHNQKNVIHKPELQLLPAEVVCEVLRAVVGENSDE